MNVLRTIGRMLGTTMTSGRSLAPGRQSSDFEVTSPDQALAICADALRSDVERVEVRIGRELANKTNPGDFRSRADRQARAFVRDGGHIYRLSVDWADALEDASRIYVRVAPKSSADLAASAAPGFRKLSPREAEAVRREIVSEFAWAARNLLNKSGGPPAVGSVRVLCRDSDVHGYIAQVANDAEAFARAFSNLARKHGLATLPGFGACFAFEPQGPATRPVGEGSISIELLADVAPVSRPKPGAVAVAEPSSKTLGTFDISDDLAGQTAPGTANVTLLGFGRELLPQQQAIPLALPGVINRSFLAQTSLATMAPLNLYVVSEHNCPLRIDVENGHLILHAKVKRGKNGDEKPSAFLVDPTAGEIALVGKKNIAARRAEVLIGGESDKVARAPDGKTLLRPVRIRIELSNPERS